MQFKIAPQYPEKSSGRQIQICIQLLEEARLNTCTESSLMTWRYESLAFFLFTLSRSRNFVQTLVLGKGIQNGKFLRIESG
jgi:hypothetical protein